MTRKEYVEVEPKVHEGFCFQAHTSLSALGGHRKAEVGAWFSSGLTLQLLLPPTIGCGLAVSSPAIFEVVELTSDMF